ncbi:MAG TPA: PAS domain-containing protein [Candidatus Udaeobacter sp.]|nr:PAS domain-containing protein [Candidatus Udaeobacter sp.]
MNEPPLQIVSEGLRQLFAYWNRLRAGRIAPAWSEIDPAAIKALLPHIIVTEFLDDPFDVRFRLIGTMIVEAYGEDFMGRNLRSLEPTGGVDLWLGLYASVVRERLPVCGRYSLSSDYVQTQYVDAGIFPLSADGVKVDKAIELEDWSLAATLAPSVLMHPAWRFDPL